LFAGALAVGAERCFGPSGEISRPRLNALPAATPEGFFTENLHERVAQSAAGDFGATKNESVYHDRETGGMREAMEKSTFDKAGL